MRDDPLGRATACAVDLAAGILLLIALGALWSVDWIFAVTLGAVIIVAGVAYMIGRPSL